MEWKTGMISRTSTFDPGITLYRVNDEIYDEIIYKNGKYYLIRRCGVENYSPSHTRKIFSTDKKILIYPLEDYEIFEQELDYESLKTFSEISAIQIINGEYQNTDLTLDVDKRYLEYIDVYEGDSININKEYFDKNRNSYIYRIKNVLPYELIDNDNFESDLISSPNIVLQGLGEQNAEINDEDVIISPTVSNPSAVKFLGNLNENNYTISLTDKLVNIGADDTKGKWYCKQYNACGYTLSSIDEKTPVVEYTWLDTKLNTSDMHSGITGALADNYTLYAYTYVYLDTEKTVSTTFSSDDQATLYLNGKQILQNTVYAMNVAVQIPFTKGWNFIEVVLQESTGGDGFNFGITLSNQSYISDLCYIVQTDTKLQEYLHFTTSNQLRAIGDIADKIYRDTDNIWKIDKRIEKYTFTGEENFQISQLNDTVNIFSLKGTYKVIENSVSCLSDSFYGVTSITRENEITITSDTVSFSLSSNDYPDLEALRELLHQQEISFYYILPNSITSVLPDQSYLYTKTRKMSYDGITELYVIDYTEHPVTVDYSTSITYTGYKFEIPVKPGKKYILHRPSVSDVCMIEYYNQDKMVIGYSDYYTENEVITGTTNHELLIPENCYYINIIDGTNSDIYDYLLIEEDSYNLDSVTINELQLNIDGSTSILTLPHALNPGDELVYDIDYETWIYYPLSLDEDFIYYNSFEPIPLVSTIDSLSCQTGLYITVAVSCINTRPLSAPTNIVVEDDPYTGDHGYGIVTWDEVPGVTEYLIYVNDLLIASVDNDPYGVESYSFKNEQLGSITIKGYNDFLTSELSDSVYIQTIPNSPILRGVDSVYENNRYYVTISFTANSSIADTYDVIYSLDGSNNITTKMEHNKVYGSEKEYTFNVPAINNTFTVQLTSSNQTGRNDYIPPITLVTNSGFSVWTYKTAISEVLLGWIDEFSDEDSYSLKYSINKGEWITTNSDGKSGSGTRLIDYIPLNPDDEMRVCLAVVRNGYTNIYSKPITVSKALDTTLVPPANFIGTKTDAGNIQFTWEDNYKVDASFELYYKYSDGTSETIYIPKESSTTGDYSYVYNVGTYGFITARIRMIWELGESEYSEEVIVYNIPIVSEAPAMLPRKRQNNQLIVSWETYEFIQKYILYFTVDGVQTIVEQVDTEYIWEIPLDKEVVSINACVKALFIDGTYTNVSNSLSFNICNNDYIVNSLIYTHHEASNNIYTTLMSRDLVTPFPFYTYSMNSYVHYYPYYEKTYTSFLFKDYTLYENYWGKGVGPSVPIQTTIMSSFIHKYKLETRIFSQVKTSTTLETTVYFPVSTTYPLYAEIVKIVIACLGDSITAGHPNYWAETGTGLINSQYEYWLSRRLKDEFNVVNKGYGQEKTADMLERFERDILPLGARYCIILGGTNDYVETYIVRCSWKLCSVCL